MTRDHIASLTGPALGASFDIFGPHSKIIEALKKTHGMIYASARTLGCDPGTIYNRAKLSKPVACSLANENGWVNDMAELKLYEAIMAGDLGAIKYRLPSPPTFWRSRPDSEPALVSKVADFLAPVPSLLVHRTRSL